MSLGRYWQTLRHLHAGQVVGRAWFRLHLPKPNLAPPPPLRPAARLWQVPAWREPSLLDLETVRFLGTTGSVSARADWNQADRDKLWLYNLHYFDDLTARRWRERRAWHAEFIRRWIQDNPPAAGTGWEPYPTSLRIANWIRWALTEVRPAEALTAPGIASLAVQARWLAGRLEFHLLGNHLWANAKALVMAGLFFDGPEAAAWRLRGSRILEEQLGEQILADGGHFERSPMYHAIVLEDVLDLVQLALVFPGQLPAALEERLREVAPRMLRWLRVMSHPDGEVSFFNDAAFGIAAPCDVLSEYAAALAMTVDEAPLRPIETLAASGYIRLGNRRAAVICDVAPVGPDHQPGHAHADTLSFELSVDGRRVVVNGGTSTYAPGPERQRQRATAAHSTVEIDGVNSSDVWGGFRVARRARPFDMKSGTRDGAVWAEGAHDGYRHLPGRVVHRRSWVLEDTALVVTDSVAGQCEEAIARFLLAAPTATCPVVQFVSDGGSPILRLPATWHPRFGESLATEVVTVPVSLPRTTTRIIWA